MIEYLEYVVNFSANYLRIYKKCKLTLLRFSRFLTLIYYPDDEKIYEKHYMYFSIDIFTSY